MNRLLLCLMLGAVLARAAHGQAPATKGALIVERRGAVGRLSVGAPLDTAAAALRRAAGTPDTYVSADGSLVVHTDAGGHITAIRIVSGDLFTTRLVRARVSTFGFVLKRYGQPDTVLVRGAELVLVYPGLEFSFDYQGHDPESDAEFAALFATPVKAITLTGPHP